MELGRRNNVNVEPNVIDQRIWTWRAGWLLGALHIGSEIELRSEPELGDGHIARKHRVLRGTNESHVGCRLRTYSFRITEPDVAAGRRQIKEDAIRISDVAAENQISASALGRELLHAQTVEIEAKRAIHIAQSVGNIGNGQSSV